MRSGHLQQVDKPERVYERPGNQFVAGFIGSPAMNMATAQLARTDAGLGVSFGQFHLAVDDELDAERPALRRFEGGSVILGIRPEEFEDAAFAPEAPPDRTLDTIITVREALGSEVLVHFEVATAGAPAADAGEFIEPLGDAGSIFVARIHPRTGAREGEKLRLVVNTSRLHFFDPATGLAIDSDWDQSGAVLSSRVA
jgi:multiple sugar transport system ATP-binding protein